MKHTKLNLVSINYLIIIITLLWMSFASEWHCCESSSSSTPTPTPTPWPEQFHALLFMNLTSSMHLQITDLWYDWPKGRNVNIIQKQLGELLYDIEWNNGTSFYYTLGGTNATCKVMHFEVGIPRPDFLDGAVYLGTQVTDGFLCNVWEKVDFIWYYEDVISNRPVRWDFYDGASNFSLENVCSISIFSTTLIFVCRVLLSVNTLQLVWRCLLSFGSYVLPVDLPRRLVLLVGQAGRPDWCTMSVSN